ncbi:hypothetical protein [Sphingomonas oryzagri]
MDTAPAFAEAIEGQAVAFKAKAIDDCASQRELGDIVAPGLRSLSDEPGGFGDAKGMQIEIDFAVVADPGIEAHGHRPVAVAEPAGEILKVSQIILIRFAGTSGASGHRRTVLVFCQPAKRSVPSRPSLRNEIVDRSPGRCQFDWYTNFTSHSAA